VNCKGDFIALLVTASTAIAISAKYLSS
jgi:hypothetical protein